MNYVVTVTQSCLIATFLFACPFVQRVDADPLTTSIYPASLQSKVSVNPNPQTLFQSTSPETEAPENAAPQIQISIRAVYAQVPLNEGEIRSEDALFDQRLEDIRSKLQLLPFQNFRLISEESDTIELRAKSSVRLSNGQKLCLRAVDMTDQNVTLWLRWSDLNGSTLLDTRMNFAKGETMVAGVESDEENAAVVLAVSAS
jgi:hypothetical protein